MTMPNELSGKVALVTGGTKGTGKAIADRLLAAGAQAIITARNEPVIYDENLHFISADLSRAEGTDKVVAEVRSKYGKLDILVNSLGGSETPAGGFSALTDEHWKRLCRPTCLLRSDWIGVFCRR
jgi:Dehydrogenases with different specificities (related to short-chain alcohol dehydrogenases)